MMRVGLAIAGIGLVLMGATLVAPPIDESTRCLARIVAILGEAFVAGGAIAVIRASFARPAPEEEAE